MSKKTSENETKPWSCGAVTLPRTNGHIYIFNGVGGLFGFKFDGLTSLTHDQIGELFTIFELPRHENMPRGEENFVLASCIQHKYQLEVTGEVTEKVETCRATYVNRYRQLIDKLNKGEVIVAKGKKEKKPRVPKERKEAGPRGKLYEASDRKPKDDAFGKQAQIVYDAIIKVGPAQPVDIAKAVDASGKLVTKQGAEKVVAFYLAQFKKSGYVKTSDPTKAA